MLFSRVGGIGGERRTNSGYGFDDEGTREIASAYCRNLDIAFKALQLEGMPQRGSCEQIRSEAGGASWYQI